jgi:hypothetical protein
MSPLKLTDDELDQVFRAAQPLAPPPIATSFSKTLQCGCPVPPLGLAVFFEPATMRSGSFLIIRISRPARGENIVEALTPPTAISFISSTVIRFWWRAYAGAGRDPGTTPCVCARRGCIGARGRSHGVLRRRLFALSRRKQGFESPRERQ